MKTQIAAVVFAAILPICAQASQPQPIPMIIDCAHPALPSQQDVARFTGIDNFAQAYACSSRSIPTTARTANSLRQVPQLLDHCASGFA